MVRSFLFSRLLGLPSLSPKARQALALEADARAYRGMVLAAEGSAEAMQAESLDERAAIARKLREGSDLYASGAAGKSALEGETSGPAVATNWFRTQLSVGTILSGEHAAHPFGISPSHLLLMLFLALVSASLIGLQLFGLQRIRKLVAGGPTSATASGTPGSVPAGNDRRVGPPAPPAAAAPDTLKA